MERISDPALQRSAGRAGRGDVAARHRACRRRRSRARPGHGGDCQRRVRCAGVAGSQPADHPRAPDRRDGTFVMTSLKILSGGAAQGLVASLAPAFKAQTGLDIEGEFGAVGAMADKLRSGTPTDVVVLTAALITDLAKEKLVVSSSVLDVGR